MSELNEKTLHALKVAFTFMPKAIEVTRYEYGEDYQRIIDEIELVREALLLNDIDPEEVDGDIHPDQTPNSCY
ncbi:penicillin-binding protein [Nitrincola tibetensis]|uniref:Penicillin-binding protein n=2 Tax=Nitrincola TaxID=267849 RepID=A0A364NPI3_9GAMM|nr:MULTISPECIES: hypothetical protein [Nitrincola]EXJ10994.1 hypothetical protein D791_02092 [Nitrincola nitratireducens]RAU18993.1 penicillin-binding protein [Nitrincola tibetensis]